LAQLRTLNKLGYKLKDLKDSMNDAEILHDLIILDNYINKKEKEALMKTIIQVLKKMFGR
jgi:response regulator of citrate/malate metabolism